MALRDLLACRHELGDVDGGSVYLSAAIASTRGEHRRKLRLEARRAGIRDA